MDWGFPEGVSTFADRIDATYGAIFYTTLLAFIIVQGLLIYSIIAFRRREGRKAVPIHGNRNLEIIWTIIPAIGVLFVAYTSAAVWLDIKSPDRFPSDAYELLLEARQFEWNVTNPGPDGILGTADDFITRNALHVPVNRPVRIILTAEDVIHSFYLPHFRVKQDAVPGMEIPVWFQATQTGEYPIACAELCGLGHYRMRGTITVHDEAEFDTWQDQQAALAMSVAEPLNEAAR